MSVEQMSDRSDLMLSDGRGTFQVSYHESILCKKSYTLVENLQEVPADHWTYGTVTTIHNFDHSPIFLQSGIKG